MRICVNGGDVVGLIAAYLCRGRGHTVVIVEPSKTLGASAYLPTHKYLERTPEVLRLLDGLGVLYGEYTLATGLLRSGQVALCPRRVSDAVHHAHWRKTRLTAMPVHSAGLSDPEVTSKRYAVSLDWRDLVKRLSTGQKVVRDISSLGGPVDLVLETVPLWESKFVKTEGARDAMAVTLNLLSVRANKDRYLRWDVVYTPHTPGNAIHRLYHGDESGYVCEFSGVVAEDAVTSDLNYLFPDGWHDDGELLATYGKLVALQERPMWADNVRAVGRMAAWDEGASLTRVVRDVLNAVGGA